MRGRRKKLDRPVAWKLRIPQSIARAVSTALMQGNSIPLGARSELTTRLYKRWLAEQAELPTPSLDDFLGDEEI